LLLYLDLAFIIRPQARGIGLLSSKTVKMKKDNNKLSAELSAIRDIKRGSGGANDAKMPGAKEIITEDRILLLLQEISDLANRNNVRLTQINTSKDVKVQEEVIAGERLLPVIINLDLSCDYHSLGRFMNALESASSYIDLQEMKVARNSGDYLIEAVNLSLKTYVKR
jgi:Tfp pilus assembly protein PilO